MNMRLGEPQGRAVCFAEEKSKSGPSSQQPSHYTDWTPLNVVKVSKIGPRPLSNSLTISRCNALFSPFMTPSLSRRHKKTNFKFFRCLAHLGTVDQYKNSSLNYAYCQYGSCDSIPKMSENYLLLLAPITTFAPITVRYMHIPQ
jgi:hypothetical protein